MSYLVCKYKASRFPSKGLRWVVRGTHRSSDFRRFLLALLLENQGVDDEDATCDDRFAESEEEVIGVCWYCGAKLRDGYDHDVVCRECLGEEKE